MMNKPPEVKPMKLEEYNSIIEDFNKYASFSCKAENELKRKYKQYVHIIML